MLQNPSHTFSAPGTYTVTFTVNGPDNEADTTTQNITILSVNASVTAAIKCFGDSNGAVGVTVTGAPGPFNYSWNTTPTQATATAINLPDGLYTVNVTAPNACRATASIQLSQPMALTHSLAVVQPGCNNPNGSISIAETGGTPPYNYSWSPAVSTGPIAVGLLPGLYITTVTDSRMCPDIINTNISAAVTPVVDISNHTNVTCKGGNNGTATATMQAANGPVSYSWNTSPVQLTATATGLKAGIYIVTMTDINGCTATDSVAITEPLSSLSTDTTIINTSCGLPNGNIILSPTGGVSPYQFTWSPLISTGANSGNIYSGNYGVTVTDSAGCSIILNNLNVINTGTPALPNLGRDTIICANQTLVLNPGTFSTYLWQNNSMAPTFNVTQSGQYFVTVTNAGGCTAKDSVLVQVQPDCSDVYFPTSFTPNGDLRNDMFGVIGNIGLISNYKLLVYNRYGELVFYTTNPSVKWNGNYKTTNPVAASYAWYATYIFRGTAKRMKYGTVTLIK